MNFGWLQDKRTRFVAQTLPSLLYFIGIFVGLANQIGFLSTTLIAIIGAVLLWIVSNRIVEKTVPQVTVPPAVRSPTKARAPKQAKTPAQTLHEICDAGPYEVEAGEIEVISLDIKQGQKLKGHLVEVDNQPFDWYIADEKNMILLRKGDFRKFKPIDGEADDNAYRVNRKIPWQARWYLILDAYRKQYTRKVRVDFEPVASLS